MVKYRAMCDDVNLGEFNTVKEANDCILQDKKATREQYSKTQKELDKFFTWSVERIDEE